MNKYKPSCIEEYIYDDNIKNSLNTMININEMSFILYGVNGCGKTSLLNCIIQQYYENSTKINENILYINNITDQGINYFRTDVKLFCQSNSTIPHKKKLILFDDFDQINDQSQQVFRNYIDKYNDKIGFIITTSNLHKIINSIQSRFLVINLTKPSKDDVKIMCSKIVKNEGIKIDNATIDTIIDLTNNNFHSIFNYLEKIKLINCNELQHINSILTHINHSLFNSYFKNIKDKTFHSAIETLLYLFNDGYSVIDILDELFIYIKRTNLLSEEEKYKIIPVICKYITIFYDIHEHEIELIFLTNNLIKIL